ncbi:MAG: MlaE family ABC transporter permease [Planctomycetota bacterium]|jgi:phospholipid/cholesterol/gamma-HCH transport system permease protein
MLASVLGGVGRHLLATCAGAGRTVILCGGALLSARQLHRTLAQLRRQLDVAGFGSLLVLSLIAGLTGMIMVMQIGPTLEEYNALGTLGGIIGVTFCRELGPIWAAVIILARVGSAMAAELGTMKVNEEVEALRVMGVNPLRYLVMPRILALVAVMPLLTAIADVVGLSGGAFVAESLFGVTPRSFWDSASNFLDLDDLYGGLIKSAVFGLVIGAIACKQGLSASGGAEGVGRVTTTTVRLCVIFVLIADLVLTAVLRLLFEGGAG